MDNNNNNNNNKETIRKNQIACRTPFEDLFTAIDLPRMILQISAMEGDAIILNLRRPREMVRRVGFRMNIKLLVGFFIFASEFFYLSIHKEHMTPEQRTVLLLLFVSGCMTYFFLLELFLRLPRRLSQQEWRQLHLMGWLQKMLMIIVLVPMVYWILQEPVVIQAPTST